VSISSVTHSLSHVIDPNLRIENVKQNNSGEKALNGTIINKFENDLVFLIYCNKCC